MSDLPENSVTLLHNDVIVVYAAHLILCLNEII